MPCICQSSSSSGCGRDFDRLQPANQPKSMLQLRRAGENRRSHSFGGSSRSDRTTVAITSRSPSVRPSAGGVPGSSRVWRSKLNTHRTVTSANARCFISSAWYPGAAATVLTRTLLMCRKRSANYCPPAACPGKIAVSGTPDAVTKSGPPNAEPVRWFDLPKRLAALRPAMLRPS